MNAPNRPSMYCRQQTAATAAATAVAGGAASYMEYAWRQQWCIQVASSKVREHQLVSCDITYFGNIDCIAEACTSNLTHRVRIKQCCSPTPAYLCFVMQVPPVGARSICNKVVGDRACSSSSSRKDDVVEAARVLARQLERMPAS
jgi:hypothetical protein